MRKFYSLLVAVAMTTNVFGQTIIAEWLPDNINTPGGLGNFGISPFTATTANSNLTVGGLTRGAGISTPSGTAGSALCWGGTDTISTSAADAITANDYVTFTITAKEGYKVSITSIEKHNVRRVATSASTGQWQYQVGSGAFTNIGSAISWGSVVTAYGNEQNAIDLTGIADLQNLAAGTTVTFRVLTWGGTLSNATWSLINGTNLATNKKLAIKGIVETAGGLATEGVGTAKTALVKNTIVENNILFGTKTEVQIINMNGEVVKSASVNENTSVDVSSLVKGTYIVTGKVNGKAVSQKIIKK